MRVSQLIEDLEQYDPDAEVFFVSQPHYPFEYSCHHVTCREEVDGYEDEDDVEVDSMTDEERDEYDSRPRYTDGRNANDVFIVEGSQVRYGSRNAFNR